MQWMKVGHITVIGVGHHTGSNIETFVFHGKADQADIGIL